jgi:hypothetical protein
MYLSRRDKHLLKIPEGSKAESSLAFDDAWKTKALNKLAKEGFFKKQSRFVFTRTNKPLLTNLDKARIIASNTFLSGDEDALAKYEALEKADPDDEASSHVTVWEPFEEWSVKNLLEVMDNLTNEIIESFQLNPNKV